MYTSVTQKKTRTGHQKDKENKTPIIVLQVCSKVSHKKVRAGLKKKTKENTNKNSISKRTCTKQTRGKAVNMDSDAPTHREDRLPTQ
jgi:hypothetical protein